MFLSISREVFCWFFSEADQKEPVVWNSLTSLRHHSGYEEKMSMENCLLGQSCRPPKNPLFPSPKTQKATLKNHKNWTGKNSGRDVFFAGGLSWEYFFLEGSFPGGFFHRTTTETNFNLNCTYVSAFLEDNGNFYGAMLEIVKG